jgi:hypothetical protein
MYISNSLYIDFICHVLTTIVGAVCWEGGEGRGGVEEFGVRKKRGRRRNLKTQKKIDDYSWEHRAILLLSISITISFWGEVSLKEGMSRFEN